MRMLISAAVISLTIGSAVLAQPLRQYQQFDVPGALFTRPFGVNASGYIVGTYRDAQGQHAFVRDPEGSYTSFDYPDAIATNAASINARGDIVGRFTDVAGFNHGYLRPAAGELAPIDPPAPCVVTKSATVVHGINDIGDMVGRCFDASGKELGWLWRHDGSFRVFDDPARRTADAWLASNRDTIVGDYTDQSNFVHGFVWSEADGFVTLDFPGSSTGVRDVNERGDFSGIYSDGARLHGFLLRDRIFETIDFPGSVNGGGTLVMNNNGLLVGGFIDAKGSEHGFIAR
jgi:hypothetical protein